MENTENLNNIKTLREENVRLNDELLVLKEYTQKILRLVKTFRNDYVIMQTKCIQNIENPRDGEVEGFSEFLRGKLHTITEVINDFHIINSIKFVDDTDYGTRATQDGVEEGKESLELSNSEDKEKNESLIMLTSEEIAERERDRENGKIMNFFGINYNMS